eukprot:SAG11_NODE_36148_length_263_cov_0.628049_1_plen_20_part_10
MSNMTEQRAAMGTMNTKKRQ